MEDFRFACGLWRKIMMFKLPVSSWILSASFENFNSTEIEI
jgi:hypothetical protein